MTEKQYENMMYALSKIIVLLEMNNVPKPSPGIPYNEIVQQAKARLENEAEKVYRDLTGVPSNREITHIEFSSSEYVNSLDEKSKAERKRAELEEEEKARLKKAEEEELARKEEEAAQMAALESLQEENDENE